MPDPKPASPPPDDDVPRHDPEEFDDAESVELGDFAPVEEGASALSFSGSTSPRNGGSSSAVRSWEELVKESASDSGITPPALDPATHVEDVDPESDQDLLKELLADEPPPSSLILKDPSKTHTALPAGDDSKVRAFELPPELAGSRPGDSSILTPLPSGSDAGQSGRGSDIFGSSSRVDLMRTGGPVMGGSAEALSGPLSAPPGPGDSQTFLSETPGPGSEASAVDLGGQAHVDLPFRPDSGVKLIGPPSHGPRSGSQGPDSGTVDLLAPGEEELGFSDSMTSPGEVKPPKRLPPVVIRQGNPIALLGGGAAGLVIGLLAFGGLWYAGVVPNQKTQPAPQPVVRANPTPPTATPDLGDWPARVQAAEKARDDEAKKAADAAAQAKKVRDELAKAVNRIQETERTGADATKQARERADSLAQQIKLVEAARTELKATLDKATADKSTADAKLRDANSTLAAQRNQLAKAEADARAAAEKSDEAEAARKQAAAFTAEVAKRLQAGVNMSTADLLASLDRALSRPATVPTTSIPATTPTTPAVEAVQTPEQGRQATWSGMTAFRTGNYYAAEQDLARVAASPQATAVDYYYLGLAQARAGHEAEADKSFRRGWELERASRPPPAEVDAAFERLGRWDRELVNRYRRP